MPLLSDTDMGFLQHEVSAFEAENGSKALEGDATMAGDGDCSDCYGSCKGTSSCICGGSCSGTCVGSTA